MANLAFAQELRHRANRSIHGLLLRAEAVSDALGSECDELLKREMLAVLGGLHVMAEAIKEVADRLDMGGGVELEAMLLQADVSMDRVDEVFA